jgi:thiol-disulfide isomerase/thioredoxin
MNERRALVLVLALGGILVTWAAVRYARHVEAGRPSPAVAAAANPEPAGTERVTLRFFRDPKPAPAFTVRDLDGREIAQASLRGKVVIVNFWATWCGPCRAEIPDLVALQEKYKDTLQVIGISEDEAGVEVVKRFAAEHQINYPVAMTTSFILDRESRVVQKHVGMLTARTTESETRHLAGLPINAAIEEVDQSQGLKLNLENGAQAMTIPGIDLASLPMAKRTEALQKLNAQPCTCGCDLTVARCRVDDPTCGVSLPLAQQIVKQIAAAR